MFDLRKKYKTKKGMEPKERTKPFMEEFNISDKILPTMLECKSFLEKSCAMYNQMQPKITGYMTNEVSTHIFYEN